MFKKWSKRRCVPQHRNSCDWTQPVLNVTNELQWPFNTCLNSLFLTQVVGLLVVWMICILTYQVVVSIVNHLPDRAIISPSMWLSQKFFQITFIVPFEFFTYSSPMNLFITWSCVNSELATSCRWVRQPSVIKGRQEIPHFHCRKHSARAEDAINQG